MNHLTNTQALIKIIEVETALLAISHKMQSGNRITTRESYVEDDEFGALADKFWSVACTEGLAFTPVVNAVFNEVKQLGYKLDNSGEWEYIRGSYSNRLYLDACENGMDENEEVEFLPGL